MRHLKIFIVLFSISLLFISTMIFQNMVAKLSPHEVDFDPLQSIPLSTIVAATPGTASTKIVYIHADEIAHIDQSVEMDQLIINGELHCDSQNAAFVSEIKARVIYVNGLFQCGTRNFRYHKKLILSLKAGAFDPRSTSAYRAILVNYGGKLILNGLTKNAYWTRLAQTAFPGQNTIQVDFPGLTTPQNQQALRLSQPSWSVGDEIVIGPSSYKPQEAEAFKITAINGNTLTLNGTLQYRHLGQKETYITQYNGTRIFDPRSEVANLTRNIVIQSDESSGVIGTSSGPQDELGCHLMIMSGGKAYVDSVEFFKMGQAGIMARYPFHWHWVGNGAGQFISNSSVHRSFQRCINIHRTTHVSVTNNVCYDFKGHGFFLEDGVETDNIISNNLGIHAKFPHYNKRLLQSDSFYGSESQGRFPNVSVYWISHPQNTIKNNVASGSVGSGFWMAFETEIRNSQNQVIANPVWTNTTLFEKNVAHSSLVGFTWDGAPTGDLTNNPNNPNDRFLNSAAYNPPTPPVFKNLTAFKNKLTGFYYRGTTAAFDGGISADNGWHYWLAFNQIIKNALIIGRSHQFTAYDQNQAIQNNRQDRNLNAGVVIYDGPFELNGVDFHQFPTQKMFAGNLEVTPVPIGTIAGFDKVVNQSKRVSFSPIPVHKAYMPPDSDVKSLELTGSTGIRDLDGTLSGSPGILVGKRSLGVSSGNQCYDLGTLYQGFQKCPVSYKETFLHFFGGINTPNVWNLPFVAQRSDGKLNYEKSEWNSVLNNNYMRFGGMRIALANHLNYDYEVMFLNNPGPEVWTISETPNPIVPVTKVIGQGQGCYLENIPSFPSLLALKNASTNGYFTLGNDIYFKLIPDQLYWTIKPGNTLGSALGYRSIQTKLLCQSSITKSIVGEVDSVRIQPNESVKIKGWACLTSSQTPLQVRLKLRNFQPNSGVIYGTQLANLSSEAAINFKCSSPNTNNYRFEFNLTKQEAQQYQGLSVILEALSPSNGSGTELNNSGLFKIPRTISRALGGLRSN